MSYPQFDGFRMVSGDKLRNLPDGAEVYVLHSDGYLVPGQREVAEYTDSDYSSRIVVSNPGTYKRKKLDSWEATESWPIAEGSYDYFCQAWVREEETVKLSFTAGDVIEVKSQQGVWCKFTVVDEPDSDGDLWVSNYVGQDYGDNKFVFWSGAVSEFEGRSGTLKVAKNEIRLAQKVTEGAPETEELSWESLVVDDIIEVQDTDGNWHQFKVDENQTDYDGSIYARSLEVEDIEIDGLYGTKDIGAEEGTWVWRSVNTIRLVRKASAAEPELEAANDGSLNWADLRVGQYVEVKDIHGNWVTCLVRDNDFNYDKSIYVKAEDGLEIEDYDGDKQYVDAGDYVWIWFDQHGIRLPEVAESEQTVSKLSTVQVGDKIEIFSQEGNWVVAEVRKNDWNRDQSLFIIVSEEGTFKAGMGDRRSIGKGCGFWAYAETNSMRLHSAAASSAPVEAAAETPEQEIARLQARLVELRRIKQIEDSRETVTLEWCGIEDSEAELTGEFWLRVEVEDSWLDRDLDYAPGYVNTRNIFRRVDN